VWQCERCWRWDGRTAGQASIKALVGVSYLHVHQLLYLHGMGNYSPRASVVVLAPCARATLKVHLGP
jgi:hypothetical protein